MPHDDFEQIDLNTFFDSQDANPVHDEKAEMLTTRQKNLIQEVMPQIKAVDPEKAENFQERLEALEALAQAVAKFPSLLERHELIGGMRTPTSLIDSLIDHQDAGDATLQLPSKAMLGKGLLVAKMHTFSSFAKYTHHIQELKKYSKAFDTETVSSMYSLLIEDVYLNLIRDPSQPMDFRREWALSLLLLWEHWNDQGSAQVAPVLESVWMARRRLCFVQWLSLRLRH